MALNAMLMALAAYAFGKSGALSRNRAPSTAIQRGEAPPKKPADVPWPSLPAPKKAPPVFSPPVPQTGPRGGKEPPKAEQRKAGSAERKQHELAVYNLQVEKKQRLAELAAAQKLLQENIAWQSAHPSEAADKGVQAQAAKVHALEQRIVDIDSEIAARKAAIAKLPK